MRLAKIKLSGFKSFVDPTSIQLPSNLIGVVGPNGCGKSNIIDAVRWVMGESSAKILRGESMADVIFNGSNARKPVGTATVELIFDNADGAIGGQYASYSEISVKRVVSRDGHSQYFLNGTRCRRRDITDIFLGTGLGPRSYSVIEQGMISQIVEARPDDIRVYLEEAAGISKYKERRRETENRIRHTRENLERLEDVREEVDKQLSHLKRQARAAERYKDLKQEERRVRAEWLTLRWREGRRELDRREGKLRELQNRVDSVVAEQRGREADMERTREEQHEAAEHFNKVQGEYYSVGSEIARLEQSIQHARDLRDRQQRELDETEENYRELTDHIALDEVQVEEIKRELSEKEPALERARESEEQAAAALSRAESDRQSWQAEWEDFSNESGEDARAADVERTRIEHLDRQLGELAERRDRLAEERRATDTDKLAAELGELEQSARAEAGNEERANASLAEARESLAQAQDEVAERGESLEALKRTLTEHHGRLSSLEALQQSSLGRTEEGAGEWLASQGLGDARRLAESLSVEPGWETAVETVLGPSLRAVLTDEAAQWMGALSELSEGSVMLADDAGAESGSRGLAAHVQGPAVAAEWLAGVHAAENLDEARAMLPRLEPGESVVTRDGEWLSRHWVRVNRGENAQRGILAREREIKSLRAEIDDIGEEVEREQGALDEARRRRDELEERRDDLQAEANTAHRRHADLAGQARSLRSRLEHLRERHEALDREAASIAEQIEDGKASLNEARRRQEQLLGRMSDQETRRRELESRRRDLDEHYGQARTRAKETRDEAHQLAVKVESLRAGLKSTEQSLSRMRSQLKHLEARRGELREQIEKADEPLRELDESLKAQLDKQVAVEKRLGEARRRVESLDERLRELDEQRQTAERQAEELREALQQEKLDQQSLRVNMDNLVEQIGEAGFEAEALAGELPDGAGAEDWQQRLEKLDGRIRRLEPVNLAAIQEHEELSERARYLQAQYDDLFQALETLESAIHKIDRQTRTGFRETFDRVNANLKELFPRLFGGGHAYLELTGEDLLTTGVTIMARPPGKRIAHIHLLSGGEKALTAVAFVFAIFRLNPSPFCLLDEVDAPLDDANVGRFSDLLREMSEQVQFLMVTHNKVTMESAHQLSGVTMREPGVSRMVSVDIDEAAQLAAS